MRAGGTSRVSPPVFSPLASRVIPSEAGDVFPLPLELPKLRSSRMKDGACLRFRKPSFSLGLFLRCIIYSFPMIWVVRAGANHRGAAPHRSENRSTDKGVRSPGKFRYFSHVFCCRFTRFLLPFHTVPVAGSHGSCCSSRTVPVPVSCGSCRRFTRFLLPFHTVPVAVVSHGFRYDRTLPPPRSLPPRRGKILSG